MITIARVGQIDPADYDKVYAIVRSLKNPIKDVEQLPELSPSQSLFYAYLDLKKQGRWGTETFEQVYLPLFLREMLTRPACDRRNELGRADKAGQNIALLCFCTEEELCHRSIVAGLLYGVGCQVRTLNGNGSEYARYYDMYRNLRDGNAPARTQSPAQKAPDFYQAYHVSAPGYGRDPHDADAWSPKTGYGG